MRVLCSQQPPANKYQRCHQHLLTKSGQLPATLLNALLPFEPTLFPKLQVYFADFPYLRYANTPEAINLEDLMRLLVRHSPKMNGISSTNIIFQGGVTIHS